MKPIRKNILDCECICEIKYLSEKFHCEEMNIQRSKTNSGIPFYRLFLIPKASYMLNIKGITYNIIFPLFNDIGLMLCDTTSIILGIRISYREEAI